MLKYVSSEPTFYKPDHPHDFFPLPFYSSEPKCYVVVLSCYSKIMVPRPAGKRSKLKLQKKSRTIGAKLDAVVSTPPGETIGPDAVPNRDPHVVTEAVVALGNTAAATTAVVLSMETRSSAKGKKAMDTVTRSNKTSNERKPLIIETRSAAKGVSTHSEVNTRKGNVNKTFLPSSIFLVTKKLIRRMKFWSFYCTGIKNVQRNV